MVSNNPSSPNPEKPQKPRSIKPLILVLAVCLAPVVAAFLAYYLPALGLRPDETTNYGKLVQPQRPTPPANELQLTTLQGEPFDLESLQGQWVLLMADQGACPRDCVEKLFILRNTHASQGENVERLVRVWLVTDDSPIPDKVMQGYGYTTILRAQPEQLTRFLTSQTVPGNTRPGNTTRTPPALTQPMWVIDPLGNLMMEFPPDNASLEERGSKVRKDIRQLLRNSRIG